MTAIRGVVAPETWGNGANMASMFPLGTRILIRQTPAAHAEIQELIDGLRPHKGSLGGGPTVYPVRAASSEHICAATSAAISPHAPATGQWFCSSNGVPPNSIPRVADLVGVDLVFGRHRLAIDRTATARQALGDGGNVILRDITVAAVVDLALNGVTRQQNAHGSRDICGMDFLAPTPAADGLRLRDISDQFVPLAVFDRMGRAVNPRRTQRTDGKTVPQAIAVHKLLQSRLVRAVVAGGPQRMPFIQGAVVQDLVVHRAGGNEHEALQSMRHCRVDQTQRAHAH